MQPVQNERPSRRRARSTTATATAERPQVIRRRKRRRKIGNTFVMLLLLGLVALMVIVFPKEPIEHAYYSVAGSSSGDRGASGVGKQV